MVELVKVSEGRHRGARYFPERMEDEGGKKVEDDN
jgi:hypothetical protein